MSLIRRNRPPLSWNEIRARAREFAANWRGVSREKAEAQTFWNEFFAVFGLSRRRVASFEENVKKAGDRRGAMDLFWPGVLLVEHKSLGGDLEKAKRQALEYFPGIAAEEEPRYIVVSDFARFDFFDLEEGKTERFDLEDLPDNAELFGFVAGYEKQTFRAEDPVNIRAAELMAGVYDALQGAGYRGDSAMFLVRALFCLFAEDTGIFDRGLFTSFIRERTSPDGSDLGGRLAFLFQMLNTPPDMRMKTADEFLLRFPYVNGSLFSAPMSIPGVDAALREKILRACDFNWAEISPAVFGSLFQHVMDEKERRGMGRHYTTEENILKVIDPLFMDKLRAGFAAAKKSKNRARLESFHKKIAGLTFLDPACGCGNFLIVAYRELRRLEIEVLRAIHPQGARALDLEIGALCRIDVDSFYGIEISEFSAQVAEVALWLTDHQMNREVSREFGDDYRRIPLKKSPHIRCANALTEDWEKIVPPQKLSYILGNPPFVGKQFRTPVQKKEMDLVFAGCAANGNGNGNGGGYGVLDYVTAWYLKAARYMRGAKAACAFVSTNSITQGEQAAALWKRLYPEGARIHFAHRPFVWTSEAGGAAQVHVVIIGFGKCSEAQKHIYEYNGANGAPHKVPAANINGYLADAPDVMLEPRAEPLCDVPKIVFGSMPNDGGALLFSDEEKKAFLRAEPRAKPYIRRFAGADEFIQGERRWCLWLKDAPVRDIRGIPLIRERVRKVRKHREASNRAMTRELAKTPALFGEIRQPEKSYLLIPGTSTSSRRYIPIGMVRPQVIVSNAAMSVPGASPYHFGVVTSEMHMAWMRTVAGRLGGAYRYSNALVYNNFPWPNPTAAQKEKVAECAKAVLAARKNHPDSSLADLYDANAMPADLARAHRQLDRAVDRAYRRAPFANERARLEFLFAEYQKLAQPIVPPVRKRRRKK